MRNIVSGLLGSLSDGSSSSTMMRGRGCLVIKDGGTGRPSLRSKVLAEEYYTSSH